MDLESFLALLKRRFIECTTYTRCDKLFSIKVSKIPPIIAPALRGDHIFNTEQQKKSKVQN